MVRDKEKTNRDKYTGRKLGGQVDWALNWRNHSHQEVQDIYGIELNRKVRFFSNRCAKGRLLYTDAKGSRVYGYCWIKGQIESISTGEVYVGKQLCYFKHS